MIWRCPGTTGPGTTGPDVALETIKAIRQRVVGRRVEVRDDIPVTPHSAPATGTCVAVHLTGHDSADLELANGHRIGFNLPAAGEPVKTGADIIGLKVEVMSGRCNRWIALLPNAPRSPADWARFTETPEGSRVVQIAARIADLAQTLTPEELGRQLRDHQHELGGLALALLAAAPPAWAQPEPQQERPGPSDEELAGIVDELVSLAKRAEVVGLALDRIAAAAEGEDRRSAALQAALDLPFLGGIGAVLRLPQARREDFLRVAFMFEPELQRRFRAIVDRVDGDLVLLAALRHCMPFSYEGL